MLYQLQSPAPVFLFQIRDGTRISMSGVTGLSGQRHWPDWVRSQFQTRCSNWF